MILSLVLFSCKSTQIVTEGKVNNKLSSKTIVQNHYANTLDFKTLRGRMKIDYDDGINAQSFSVSLRMEKDNAIWISAPLGLLQ